MKIAIRIEGKRIDDLACIPIKEGQVPPETRRARLRDLDANLPMPICF
jgi:hypothetical protein